MSDSKNGIIEQIRSLEAKLLDPKIRRSAEQVSPLLAEDFVEFGSSGRLYDKAKIIEALQDEQRLGATQAVTVRDFSARLLSDAVVLATYRTERQNGGQSRRSSLWRFQQGRWQMIFHQGTPIPAGIV